MMVVQEVRPSLFDMEGSQGEVGFTQHRGREVT